MKKESFIDNLVKRAREYGEGICMFNQSIKNLRRSPKSNSYTKISFNQGDMMDMREMAAILGLNTEQAQRLIMLNVGEAIIRKAGTFPFPQEIKIPLIDTKNISDKEIDAINKNNPVLKKILNNVIPGNDQSTNRQEKINQQEYPPKQRISKLDRLMDILLDIDNRFDVASTQRAKDLNLSASASDKIYKKLEKDQLVECFRINLTGKKGGLSKYHSLTKKGLEFSHRSAVKQSGGTGAMHHFLQRYLKKYLPDKGFKELVIEKNLGGKRIDLFGIYNEKSIGIEICCSTFRTEYLNVIKNEGKVDCLFITAPDKKTKERLEKEIYKNVLPEIKFKVCLVSELLGNPDELIYPEIKYSKLKKLPGQN